MKTARALFGQGDFVGGNVPQRICGAYGTAGRAEQSYSKIADAQPGQKEAGCACPLDPLKIFRRPGISWPGLLGGGVD